MSVRQPAPGQSGKPRSVPQRRKRQGREKASFYDAVLALRRAGHRVYRGGFNGVSVVDGVPRSNIGVAAVARRGGRW